MPTMSFALVASTGVGLGVAVAGIVVGVGGIGVDVGGTAVGGTDVEVDTAVGRVVGTGVAVGAGVAHADTITAAIINVVRSFVFIAILFSSGRETPSPIQYDSP